MLCRTQHTSSLTESVTQVKVAFEPATTTVLRGPRVILPTLAEMQTQTAVTE